MLASLLGWPCAVQAELFEYCGSNPLSIGPHFLSRTRYAC